MVFCWAMIGFMFYSFSLELCKPMIDNGVSWVFFALIGVMATAFGIVGSVFMTYVSLYRGKDNELLLAMPISPSKILFSRIAGVYLLTFIFEVIVLIPAFIVYNTTVIPSALPIIFQILILFILPLFAVTVSCVLGWLIGLIASRLTGSIKNFVTIIMTIAFLAVYFVFYSRIYEYFNYIIMNVGTVGNTLRTYIYPLYQMGLAAGGNIRAMLIFGAIILALFALLYFVLSKSFIRIATSKQVAAKVKYKKKALKSSSSQAAFLRKEFFKFFGSSLYLINASLGSILYIIVSAFVIIKKSAIDTVLNQLLAGNTDYLPAMLCGVLLLISSMNIISAPSVSLEGKSVWIPQSLPVNPWIPLRAKLLMHVLLTAIPGLICTAIASVVFAVPVHLSLLTAVSIVVFTAFMSAFGLLLGLKMPNMNWTNEAVVIKQSAPVVISLFAGLGFMAILVLPFIPLMAFVPLNVYWLAATVLLAIATFVLIYWIKNSGAKIFSDL